MTDGFLSNSSMTYLLKDNKNISTISHINDEAKNCLRHIGENQKGVRNFWTSPFIEDQLS